MNMEMTAKSILADVWLFLQIYEESRLTHFMPLISEVFWRFQGV